VLRDSRKRHGYHTTEEELDRRAGTGLTDGYLQRYDERGAVIVADGLHFP
jgi:hypothetical protein